MALWLTTLIVAGVDVVPYGEDTPLATVLTYLLVGADLRRRQRDRRHVVRVVAFPLYVLTLGLISLSSTGCCSASSPGSRTSIGFGLEIEGFWWGVLGALVLGDPRPG